MTARKPLFSFLQNCMVNSNPVCRSFLFPGKPCKYWSRGFCFDFFLGVTDVRHPEEHNLSALHFNDAALDNLGRKEINSRLVLEIIAHPAFEKLITDIEIYVDGYVQQAMDQLNTMREYRRRKLIKGRTLSAQYNFIVNAKILFVLAFTAPDFSR